MVDTAETLSTEEATSKAEKRRIYIERVDTLIKDIKAWLPEALTLEVIENGTAITDETGSYHMPTYLIVQSGLPEPDNLVAELFPEGCSVLLADGLVDVYGSGGTEHIMYMRKEYLIVTDAQGQTRQMFKDVDQDGWYWLESTESNRALPLNREILENILEIAGCVI